MTTTRSVGSAIGRPSVSPTMYDRSHTAIMALAVAAWRATTSSCSATARTVASAVACTVSRNAEEMSSSCS